MGRVPRNSISFHTTALPVPRGNVSVRLIFGILQLPGETEQTLYPGTLEFQANVQPYGEIKT